MKTYNKYNGSGLTARDISELADWINEANISPNTPVYISQHEPDKLLTPAVDIKADDESINIYDWL